MLKSGSSDETFSRGNTINDGFLRGERVLVTGGAGYIGSHVCKALAAEGIEPVVVDNLSRGHEWAVKWGPLIRADLADYESLSRAVASCSPAAVVHLAGFTYVGESTEQPLLYYRNNVAGSLNLLRIMAEQGIRLMVFSSSAAVYGVPASTPISESHPLAPINPYGFTKMVIERVLEDTARAGGLRSVSLRYFNAAGADPEREIGEEHDPETHLIPLVLAVAKGAKPTLTIFGNDYDTPDGTCVRDYIHVSDLASAHVLALRNLSAGGKTRAFNLGTGVGYSVREVIDAVEKVTGRHVDTIAGSARAGDPPRLVSKPSAALQALGWRAINSDLETIIETAWRWMNRP